jgi:hypothetical protein
MTIKQMTRQFKPDIIIGGFLVKRMYSDIGICYHYTIRFKAGKQWIEKIVSSEPIQLTSRHQPIPSRLPDDMEFTLISEKIVEIKSSGLIQAHRV